MPVNPQHKPYDEENRSNKNKDTPRLRKIGKPKGNLRVLWNLILVETEQL